METVPTDILRNVLLPFLPVSCWNSVLKTTKVWNAIWRDVLTRKRFYFSQLFFKRLDGMTGTLIDVNPLASIEDLLYAYVFFIEGIDITAKGEQTVEGWWRLVSGGKQLELDKRVCDYVKAESTIYGLGRLCSTPQATEDLDLKVECRKRKAVSGDAFKKMLINRKLRH